MRPSQGLRAIKDHQEVFQLQEEVLQTQKTVRGSPSLRRQSECLLATQVWQEAIQLQEVSRSSRRSVGPSGYTRLQLQTTVRRSENLLDIEGLLVHKSLSRSSSCSRPSGGLLDVEDRQEVFWLHKFFRRSCSHKILSEGLLTIEDRQEIFQTQETVRRSSGQTDPSEGNLAIEDHQDTSGHRRPSEGVLTV